MEDETGSDLATQMEAARELLEGGDVKQALILALEVLWAELDRLQDALETIEENLPQDEPRVPEAKQFDWPDMPSQALH